MDKRLPHPELCTNQLLETLTQAVLETGHAASGTFTFKDVLKTSFLADWTRDDWAQYNESKMILLAETFDLLVDMGFLQVEEEKKNYIIVSVTEQGATWAALDDDEAMARAFADGLAQAWFAQVDTGSIDAFDHAVNDALGEQQAKETVEKTYDLLDHYGLLGMNTDVTQPSKPVKADNADAAADDTDDDDWLQGDDASDTDASSDVTQPSRPVASPSSPETDPTSSTPDDDTDTIGQRTLSRRPPSARRRGTASANESPTPPPSPEPETTTEETSSPETELDATPDEQTKTPGAGSRTAASDDALPNLKVGGDSPLRRRRRGTSNDDSEASEEEATQRKRGGALSNRGTPSNVRPGSGSSRRGTRRGGGARFRSSDERETREGQSSKDDLPYLRPGKTTGKKPSRSAQDDAPEGLPTGRPSIGGRRGGGRRGGRDRSGLPGGGGSPMDQFRKSARKRDPSSGDDSTSQADDIIEHIVGAMLDGVQVDIALRNGDQYEVYENDERVFYASRETVEAWREQHGEDHIGDAVLNYRDHFIRQLNREDDAND